MLALGPQKESKCCLGSGKSESDRMRPITGDNNLLRLCLASFGYVLKEFDWKGKVMN